MPVGDLIANRYRLEERIAAGGMGDVWRGHDTRLNRPVAVKMLHPGLSDNAEFRARFVSEAMLVAALNTRSVAAIYDYGEESTPNGDLAYLIMELVEGRSLADVLSEKGALPAADTARVIAAAANGLHAAHSAGIVHRDVKPANILVNKRGIVKIIDFGIARGTGKTALTATGMMIGTLPYSAPEHIANKDPAPAGDIYSLGIVAYECLTGAPPFGSENPQSVMYGHIFREPPPLPDDVPAALSNAIMTALRKEPADRWATVLEFGEACGRATGTHAEATPNLVVIGGVAAPEPEAEPVVGEEPTEPLPESEAEAVPEPETVPEPEAVPEPETVPEPAAADPDVPEPPATVPDETAPEREPEEPTARPHRRRRLLVTACVAAAVLLAGLLIWQPWLHRGPNGGNGASGDRPSHPSSLSGEPGQQSSGPQGDGSPSGGSSPEPTTGQTTTPGNGDPGTGENGGGGEPPAGGGNDGGGDPPSGGGSDPDTAVVPDLTGVQAIQVKDRLRQAGFDNSSGEAVVSSKRDDCEVFEQSPAAGTRVSRSKNITFRYVDGFPMRDCMSASANRVTESAPTPAPLSAAWGLDERRNATARRYARRPNGPRRPARRRAGRR